MSRKTKAEVLERLREMAGTPQDMATALGIESTDATFRRALKELEDEGVLIAEGTTRNRHYRNARAEVNGQPPLASQLLSFLPCSAREFSEKAHKLDLEGKALGDLKLKLGIETVKGQDGRWYCRDVPGYTGPETTARQDAGLTTDEGYTDGEEFAPLAARAAKVSKGGVIGGRVKEKAGA